MFVIARPFRGRSNLRHACYEADGIYIFNRPRGVLYTGVANDLYRRMVEHKQRLHGFTAKYNVTKLGQCEYFQDIRDAILREKQIKAGNRKKKIELIESQNPKWNDLFENEF